MILLPHGGVRSAVLASYTGKGSDGRVAGDDDDGLTLGYEGAYPKVEVVGAVALVEGSGFVEVGWCPRCW